MKSVTPSLLALIVAGSLGALVAKPTTAGPGQPTVPPFSTFDSNGDGSVSLEEFQAQGGLVKAFHDGDVNRDLKLSRDELAMATTTTDRLMGAHFVDDAVITAKVKTQLLKDEIVKGLNVHVETNKGTVQLSGWVADEKQIAQAEQLARRIEGVRTIRNDLQVQRESALAKP